MRTIIWDIDDTLNALTREWFEQEWRPSHPDCRLDFDGLTSNPPHELLGCEKAEYLSSLDRFRLSPEGRNLAPVPEMVEWFKEYGAKCRHAALTARPFSTVPSVSRWLFQHFSPWIRAFGFVPSARPDDDAPSYDAGKGDWLRWAGLGDILVDDSRENVAAAAALGLETVLMPQPWNGVEEDLADTLRKINRLAGMG